MKYIEKTLIDRDGVIHEPGLVEKLLNNLLELFFPMGTYCVSCGKYINGTRKYCLCDHCIKHFGWGFVEIDVKKDAEKHGRTCPLDSARACTKYGIYERTLVFDLKYNGKTYDSRIIAGIMADRVVNDRRAVELLHSDYIIPVPVHASKLKSRGFNQMEKVGKHLSKLLGIPMRSEALVRIHETKAQRSLSGEERFRNLQGAFRITDRESRVIRNKKIILIDDIYTSGATAEACAYALKEAGAEEVHCLVLASRNDFAEGFFDADSAEQSTIC